MNFEPDYRNIALAALNKFPYRLPLYEHNISPEVVEAILGKQLPDLQGSLADRKEYFRLYTNFCKENGYDVVPFEGCITELIQGGEALCGRTGSIIHTMKDLEEYPWDDKVEEYFNRFELSFQALTEVMPAGMKAVGGIGNGIFEVVQDFVPLTELAYLQIDEPEVYAELWKKVEQLMLTIWQRFLVTYADTYAVCRMGDDLGFATSTLISPQDISTHIIPGYAHIGELVHSFNKPFLLHSCGAIFPVMDEIIAKANINAKHSNEDNIAPFQTWIELYSDRIGLFGGVDMNVLCLNKGPEITDYVNEILHCMKGLPGLAIGSGNQIADYVPPESFLTMVETVRRFRGE